MSVEELLTNAAARDAFGDMLRKVTDLERLVGRLHELLQIPGEEVVRGAGGIAEGMPAAVAQATLPKFRPDGILLVHCGGRAGLFSAIIAGWLTGAEGSQPVTREIVS